MPATTLLRHHDAGGPTRPAWPPKQPRTFAGVRNISKLLVLPRQHLGPESSARRSGAGCRSTHFFAQLQLHLRDIGLASLQRSGATLPPDLSSRARAEWTGTLLGPISTLDYPPATERNGINVGGLPQLDLFAQHTSPPRRCHRGAAMDLVIMREGDGGHITTTNMHAGSGGIHADGRRGDLNAPKVTKAKANERHRRHLSGWRRRLTQEVTARAPTNTPARPDRPDCSEGGAQKVAIQAIRRYWWEEVLMF